MNTKVSFTLDSTLQIYQLHLETCSDNFTPCLLFWLKFAIPQKSDWVIGKFKDIFHKSMLIHHINSKKGIIKSVSHRTSQYHKPFINLFSPSQVWIPHNNNILITKHQARNFFQTLLALLPSWFHLYHTNIYYNPIKNSLMYFSW